MNPYRERAALVALLAAMWPSSLEQPHPEPDFTYVVYIDSPVGQLSWHIADVDLDLFSHTPRDQGREWDGHDSEQKVGRLRMLVRQYAEPTMSQPRGS